MGGRIEKQTVADGVECQPDCGLCPKRCDNSSSVCMEGEGPSNALLMVVGESPWETDDEMNRPFVGPMGEYLRDDILVAAGIPESEIRFTYAVRCRALKDKAPSVSEIKRCRRYLEAEIARVKPRVIVAMGDVALASLMQSYYKGQVEEGAAKKQESKVGGIGKWQGKRVWLREFGCWLMPSYPISACVDRRGRFSTYQLGLVVQAFKVAWEAARKDLPDFPMPVSLTVTDTVKIMAVLGKMQREKSFAFDIETGGSGRASEKYIIGFSLSCDPELGYYIPWDSLVQSRPAFSLFKELVTDRECYKVMHNGAYETRILGMVYGIHINSVKYFDTMIGAHLMDENFSKRLKDLAWVHTSFGGYDTPLEKYKEEHRIKEDYSQIPIDILEPYGAFDSIATWIIYMVLKPNMVEDKVFPLFDKVLMPVRRVMNDAEYNGMRVNLDRATMVDDLCKQAVSKLEENIYACAGRRFNIGSPKQLQDVLFKDMGFTPLKETKTGFSADSATIDYIATQPDSEIATYLSDRSYVSTMRGTHVSQAIAFTWPEDGRVHTNYNLTGAVTGRCSCSAPSLQNVPSDAMIRSLYIASEGCMLVEADLKSAEMATIAAISGEETFLKAFAEGLDIHSETYRKLYSLPADYVCSKLERRKAKAINFGLVYGMSPMGLATRLQMTVEEATDFMELYFTRLPNVARWMEAQKAKVREEGFVVSVFGRKRRLPLGMSDQWGDIGRAERQAMNSPIQSGAADYTYVGLVRLRRAILKARLHGKIVHTVHDCVVTDTPEGEVARMTELIREAFETSVSVIPVKMHVDVEVNQRWGQNNESRLQGIFDKVGLKLGFIGFSCTGGIR